MKFDYHLPVNLAFGRGRIGELGTQTAKYGKRALLVSGGSSAKKSGLLDRTECSLKRGKHSVSELNTSEIQSTSPFGLRRPIIIPSDLGR